MKITTTAGTLKKGDKIGKRVVHRTEFREFNLGYHVFFEGCEAPMPYGRNEPITVEPFSEPVIRDGDKINKV